MNFNTYFHIISLSKPIKIKSLEIKTLISTSRFVNSDKIETITGFRDSTNILIIDDSPYYISNGTSYLDKLKNGMCLEYLDSINAINTQEPQVIMHNAKNDLDSINAINTQETQMHEKFAIMHDTKNDLDFVSEIDIQNKLAIVPYILNNNFKKGKIKNKITRKHKHYISESITLYDIYKYNKNIKEKKRFVKNKIKKGYDNKLKTIDDQIIDTFYIESLHESYIMLFHNPTLYYKLYDKPYYYDYDCDFYGYYDSLF